MNPFRTLADYLESEDCPFSVEEMDRARLFLDSNAETLNQMTCKHEFEDYEDEIWHSQDESPDTRVGKACIHCDLEEDEQEGLLIKIVS